MQVQEGVARMLEVHIQNFSYGKKEILNRLRASIVSDYWISSTKWSREIYAYPNTVWTPKK